MALLSDKFKLKPQLSGADIKSLYEVEPNAFTDTDKTKLIGIEAEAQVTWIITSVKTSNYIAANNERIPCNTSGGPFTITLPNSGRVSVFDINGTTPVTGFGVNSLTINPNSGQTVMGDNTLEVDIGASSVELYLVGTDWRIVDGITSADNASLDVVPGSLLTDGSVSSNKLDASVNVSLGLADTALQPDQALFLPNNSRINGVEHFYQTTKPTVRGDSSALVAGDRWWKTDEGIEAFWNGTYWVGTAINYYGGTRSVAGAFPNFTDGTASSYPQGRKVLLRDFSYSLSLSGAGDVNNYYYFVVYVRRGVTSPLTAYTSPTKIFNTGRNHVNNEVLNVVVTNDSFLGSHEHFMFYFTSTTIGSPPSASNPTGNLAWSVIYE